MGAKPEFVKRIALEIYNRYPDKVSADFEENKKLVSRLLTSRSKKVRNMVAGYLTRLKRKIEEGRS
jgi:small subunit ribosomal protein S17e